MATLRALPTRISWVHRDHGNTCEYGLVGNKDTELSKLPIMQPSTLAASGLNPIPDARQIFQGDSEIVALRRLNDALGNAMVSIFLKSRLFTADLSQLAFSGRGPFLLKVLAPVGKFSAILLHGLARVIVALRIGSNIDDAKIHPKNATGFNFLGVVNIADTSDIKNAVDQHQVNFAFPVNQESPLMLPTFVGDGQSTFNGPDRQFCVRLDSENSVIVGLGGVFSKFSLGVASRLIGIRNLANTAYHHLCRQIKALAYRFVDQLVEPELLKHFTFPSLLGNPVTDSVCVFQGFLKCRKLFRIRPKFYVGNQLHVSSIEYLASVVKQKSTVLLPGLNAGVSRAI